MTSKNKVRMGDIAALFIGIAMAFAELGIMTEVVNTETLTQLIVGWLSAAYWLTLTVFIWNGFIKNEYKLDFTLMITAACCASVGHTASGFIPLFGYAHLSNAIIWGAMAGSAYIHIPPSKKTDTR